MKQDNQFCPIGDRSPDLLTLQRYFDKVRRFPKLLITQNDRIMQKAYTMVPADIWAERVHDLQDALRLSGASEVARQCIVTAHRSGMSDMVDSVLDRAFLNKYDELLKRVVLDFEDYFPYRVARTNEKLFIFEKLNGLELVKFVMQKVE